MSKWKKPEIYNSVNLQTKAHGIDCICRPPAEPDDLTVLGRVPVNRNNKKIPANNSLSAPTCRFRAVFRHRDKVRQEAAP